MKQQDCHGCHKMLDINLFPVKKNGSYYSRCNKCTLDHRKSSRECYVKKKKILLGEYPELCKEWDYEKNDPKRPEDYSPGSGIKVWWVCKKNSCGCHVWLASINNRTKKIPTGCPYCHNLKLCDHNNLLSQYPELCKEWDYVKNEKGPEKYSCGSYKKVWWICKKNPCGCHKWSAPISSRTGKISSGCPYCSNKKLCDHNNLLSQNPELCKEWDYVKNEKGPEKYSPGSHKKVWWICKKNPCGCHKWATEIHNRIRRGCPFCSNKKLCDHNNLLSQCPELCKEWDYAKNEKGPEKYSPCSNSKVFWICKENVCHTWNATPNHRTSQNKTGCPFCKSTYSQKGIQYLDSIAYSQDIIIQHAENSGEYHIPGTSWKADGYHSETNTIYEFHGTYWHGHPNYYDPSDIHTSIKGKTYGELYQRTLKRDEKIRKMGYNLVVMWEHEWDVLPEKVITILEFVD